MPPVFAREAASGPYPYFTVTTSPSCTFSGSEMRAVVWLISPSSIAVFLF